MRALDFPAIAPVDSGEAISQWLHLQQFPFYVGTDAAAFFLKR